MKGVLLETDVIVEFLATPDPTPTLLRRLLQCTTCFTTFIQAAEIYSVVRDDQERRIVERALFGLKILGASGRYAATIGRLLASSQAGTIEAGAPNHRAAIVAAMAIESRLPVITNNYVRALTAIEGTLVLEARALMALGDEELADLIESSRPENR